MGFCPKCGTQFEPGTKFCAKCGYPVSEGAAAAGDVPPYNPQQSAAPHEMTKDELPRKFRPLGAWAYFGYSLLFSIPVVGLIFLIVYACGGTENINLRGYARSYFCWYVIIAVIVVILLLAGVSFSGLNALYNLF